MKIIQNIKEFFALYLNKSLMPFFILGIISAIPLPLTAASVLSVMLKEKGVNLAIIATFSLSALPYSFKYLWAPLLDAYGFKPFSRFLSKRNSWLPITQILLALAICFLGSFQGDELFSLRIATMCVAALSATQDILIDSLRIRSLPITLQGAGSTIAVLGYRMGMIIASAGSLYIAEYTESWTIAYCGLAGLILLAIPITFLTAMRSDRLEQLNELEQNNLERSANHSITDNIKHLQSKSSNQINQTVKKNLYLKEKRFSKISDIFLNPLISFIKSHHRWYLILLSLIFYKLSDAYLGAMTNPFLLELGFTKGELATIIKIYGTIATFVGMFFGGYMIAKLNIVKCFYIGIILQSVSNLTFIFQYYSQYNCSVLIYVNSIESFCGGVSSSVLVAFISSLCQRQFTASHYAMFASLASLGRTLIASTAGLVVENVGWCSFFVFSSLLSLPGLICLYCAQRKDVQNK